MKTTLTTLGVSLLIFASCAGQKKAESNFIQDNTHCRQTLSKNLVRY